ncbi:metal-sensing transcriptional repressor [Patescibacteria group bacterium]|nr:metal-sensing transcriptional repressor [Patescibacteria group bacterium]
MEKNIKNRTIHRLKILEGQIRGLQKMIEKEKYCIDIIHQSLAAKQALSSIEDLILENHLSTYVIEQIKAGKKLKSAKEILEIYKLSKKK